MSRLTDSAAQHDRDNQALLKTKKNLVDSQICIQHANGMVEVVRIGVSVSKGPAFSLLIFSLHIQILI